MKKLIALVLATGLFCTGFTQVAEKTAAVPTVVKAADSRNGSMEVIAARLEAAGIGEQLRNEVLAEETRLNERLLKLDEEKLGDEEKTKNIANFKEEKENRIRKILGEETYRKYLETAEKPVAASSSKTTTKTKTTSTTEKSKTKTVTPVMQSRIKTAAKKN